MTDISFRGHERRMTPEKAGEGNAERGETYSSFAERFFLQLAAVSAIVSR